MASISLLQLRQLKTDIEKKYGLLDRKTSEIIAFLAENLDSPSKATIERIWRESAFKGVEDTNTKKTFGNNVIDDLVKILGFPNYIKYFKVDLNDPLNRIFNPDKIVVDNLVLEKELIIGWIPSHFAKLKYLGEYKFQVIETSDENHFGNVGEVIFATDFKVEKYWDYEYALAPNGEEVMVEGFSPNLVVRWDYNHPIDLDDLDKVIKIKK